MGCGLDQTQFTGNAAPPRCPVGLRLRYARNGHDICYKKHKSKGFGVESEDIKNLSISNLLFKLSKKAEGEENQNLLKNLLDMAIDKGLADKTLNSLGF